jgi:hypothetical protein
MSPLSHHIAKVRRAGYPALKALGDLQALASGSPAKVRRRIERRVAGKFLGRNILRRVR